MNELLSSETIDLWRVFFLLDYNTRLVVISTTFLGIASGLVGSFLLLRKRSLMGDALSHATLPGIAIAFIILVTIGREGKELGWLLVGAFTSGIIGCLTIRWITEGTKIKGDTAMGIVLSVFFGAGVALLGVIQRMPEGNAAGLESYIYGKTASMVFDDFLLITAILCFVILTTLIFYKELLLLCFDQGFAQAQGWSVRLLDIILLLLVALVTVAGLQSVGLILMIAFLITPAAAARMWTFQCKSMLWLSGVIGGLSGWLGALLSAVFPDLPAGAVIVLVASTIFIVSIFFGKDRGMVLRWRKLRALKKKVALQHLMRAIYEIAESEEEEITTDQVIDWKLLLNKRSWKSVELMRIIQLAYQEAWLSSPHRKEIRFTEKGLTVARRMTKNHRLWELYLIKYADIAANHVDRDADNIEHVLGREMTARLEKALVDESSKQSLPPSPHPL